MTTLQRSLLWLVVALPCMRAGGLQAEELYLYGEYLSGECVTCHRLDDDASDIPPIFGWAEDKFIETLAMYKHGLRENQAMRNVAVSLGEEEMAALARFYASQTAKESAR